MVKDLSQEHYLNKADLSRYFGISRQKAIQLFTWADKIDTSELAHIGSTRTKSGSQSPAECCTSTWHPRTKKCGRCTRAIRKSSSDILLSLQLYQILEVKMNELVENIITIGFITGIIPFALSIILIGAVGVLLG